MGTGCYRVASWLSEHQAADEFHGQERVASCEHALQAQLTPDAADDTPEVDDRIRDFHRTKRASRSGRVRLGFAPMDGLRAPRFRSFAARARDEVFGRDNKICGLQGLACLRLFGSDLCTIASARFRAFAALLLPGNPQSHQEVVDRGAIRQDRPATRSRQCGVEGLRIVPGRHPRTPRTPAPSLLVT